MLKKLDLTGFKNGRLTVICEAPKNKFGQIVWHCSCECGGSVDLIATVIHKGKTLSCGCLHRETTSLRNTTHGGYGTTEYSSYRSMLTRCYNESDKNYLRYGAIGISVCERWRNSFENFLADMGPKPSKLHSIDRFPNMDGIYEPSNCRWGTDEQQARNRHTTILNEDKATEIRQSGLTPKELAIKYGVSRRSISGVLTKKTWKLWMTNH